MPALYNLDCDGLLDERFAVLGAAVDPLTTESFRTGLGDDIRRFHTRQAFDAAAWDQLVGRFHYMPAAFDDLAAFQRLRAEVARLDATCQAGCNVLLYLATAPRFFGLLCEQLYRGGFKDGPGWGRFIVEKPFGTDLASARQLNRDVLAHWQEEQICRVDPYLGKETVQNLLAFRFSNGMFEPLKATPADFPNHARGRWGPTAASDLVERDARRWFEVLTDDVLKRVAIFKDGDPLFLAQVILALRSEVAHAGETIIRKGDIGHEMYIVVRGEAEVLDDGGRVIKTFRDGDFFGEISLLIHTPRTVTVRATTDCDLVVLDQPSLRRILHDHPQFADSVRAGRARALRPEPPRRRAGARRRRLRLSRQLHRPLRAPAELRLPRSLQAIGVHEPERQPLIAGRRPRTERDDQPPARLTHETGGGGGDRLTAHGAGHHAAHERVLLAEYLPGADHETGVAGPLLLLEDDHAQRGPAPRPRPRPAQVGEGQLGRGQGRAGRAAGDQERERDQRAPHALRVSAPAGDAGDATIGLPALRRSDPRREAARAGGSKWSSPGIGASRTASSRFGSRPSARPPRCTLGLPGCSSRPVDGGPSSGP